MSILDNFLWLLRKLFRGSRSSFTKLHKPKVNEWLRLKERKRRW